jgi:hypothetical protein
MQVYYKTGYGGVNPHTVKNFPAGLRIVAGNSKSTTPESDQVVRFQCNNSDGASFNHIPTNAEGNAGGCAPGTWLVMEISFPQCWDGVHLDSADHQSHMAYPTGSGCPADHPVPLAEITERALYTVPAGGMPNSWRSVLGQLRLQRQQCWLLGTRRLDGWLGPADLRQGRGWVLRQPDRYCPGLLDGPAR